MKMEIDLTDAQAEKVQMLQENGIEVGEAIEMFFEMRDKISESSNEIVNRRIQKATEEKTQLEEKMAQLDSEINFFNKIKDSAINPSQKQKLVEKEYGLTSKSYDESVQDTKHKLKWGKFFKF